MAPSIKATRTRDLSCADREFRAQIRQPVSCDANDKRMILVMFDAEKGFASVQPNGSLTKNSS